MNNPTPRRFSSITITFFSTALLAGCHSDNNTEPPLQSAQTPAQAPGVPGQNQTLFDTDAQAGNALVDAVKSANHAKVHAILGPAWKELISGDKVQDANGFKEFAAHAAERSHVDKKDDKTSTLYVGEDDWPFPIPIAKNDAGKWFFDTESGKQEILDRRIGEDELQTISVCLSYPQAQRDYASKVRDGSSVKKFAQHILSHPGKKDGLYWDPSTGEENSPLGPLIDEATSEGYDPHAGGAHQPFHGYRYRILKRQGAAAADGAQDYIVDGNMTGGFALVAFPAEYGSSGIMTFIINQEGKLYQKDLGPNTAHLAWQMTDYNPDNTWTLVKN